jgi:hypothetical protein
MVDRKVNSLHGCRRERERRTDGICTMRWVPGSEAWSSFLDNVRPMDLQNMTMCELWVDRRFRDSRESSY